MAVNFTPEVEIKSKQGENALITTPEAQDQRLINGVVQAVNPAIPEYTSKQATPITAESPVPDHQVWETIGADRVGSEKLDFTQELDTLKRDWQKRLWRWFIKPFRGGNENRSGRLGKLFISMAKWKGRKVAFDDKKTDPDAHEIGE